MPEDTKYIINESQLTAIGNSIRTKLGEQDTYTVDEMPTKIGSISVAGGDSIPIRYIKCNIVNNTNVALYAGNTGLNPDFCLYALNGSSAQFPYTMEGANALITSDIDTPIKIADADGGTGVIYYIPSYYWKTQQPDYIILRVDSDSANITNKTNVTWYEDNGDKCIKLTDISQNGEFTWAITTPYYPD